MNVNSYLDYINTPWGQLFYKLLWHNLVFKNKKILDFGSGFGLTANFLSKNNDVTAVEPNSEMLKYRISDNNYRQITGSIEEIIKMDDNSFDVIICHNVLEYINNKKELINQFNRLLKANGVLSIVKHNRYGKVMHKAIFENNIDEAFDLVNEKPVTSNIFGDIKEYTIDELKKYLDGNFEIKNIFGIRAIYGLQNNSLKYNIDWIEKMYALECAIESNPFYSNIAYFHHVLIKKV